MDNRPKCSDEHITAAVEHVDTPDAQERLCRALDLILRVAARSHEQETTPPSPLKEEGDAPDC